MNGEHAALIEQLDVEPQAAQQFERYLETLLKWNARMNLTAIRQPEEIVCRHLRECIFAAQLIPPTVGTLLDFGSGAGLPGIPVAICRPEIRVTLAESQAKKASFLREAVRETGIDTEIWARRVEEMPEDRLFDAVMLRAVDRMAEACRAAVERLSPGGWLGVFATTGTEKMLVGLEIRWAEAVALPGSDSGLIRTGFRK